jgi:hypothetical protein
LFVVQEVSGRRRQGGRKGGEGKEVELFTNVSPHITTKLVNIQ